VCGTNNVLQTSLGDLAAGVQPIAVAFDGSGDLLVQTREPAQLWMLEPSGGRRAVTLSTTSRRDTGHDLFHVQAGEMIACASCHPEGREDGHVWNLDGHLRRTPSLSATIAGTAPYHWPGDFKDLGTLVQNVYTVRMGGSALAGDELSVLEHWVLGVPSLPAPSWVDANAATRGKAIYENAGAACSTCHSGPKLTNNETMDVGTGAAYQVPPLVGVGWRTPLMHDGCAATIADRFGSCSTSTHGDLTSLSPGDISDLSAYLETL
jgi:cytochrome c peroxidase